MLIFLEHDDARALAHHEAVAALVIGAARLFGGVVAAHVQRARLREARDADRADRRFGAAREHDVGVAVPDHPRRVARSEEHTSELQSLMRTSYAVFCCKTNNITRVKA